MATQFSVQDGIPWKKRFFTIWVGQVVSLLGSQLVSFALVWYLTVTTESATVLAISSMVGILPSVLLGPFIGPLIDRWDRRKVMIAADSVVMFATLGLSLLFWLSEVGIWQIYVLMFIRAVAGGFHGNAMSASSSLMVPREHLARVQGLNQMLNGGLNIIAAPIGAILYEALELQWILMIDVFTAVVAIVPLFFFEIPQPDRSVSEKLSGKQATFFEDMKAGFRYMWNWKGLFILSMMAALLNFLLTPTGAFNPLLIKEYYGGSVLDVGTLNAIFGIGVIIGGALLGAWGGFKRKIFTSMLGILMIGIGILVQGIAPSNMLPLAFTAAGVAGFGMPVANGTIGAIVQADVAPDMQGRVFSLLGTFAGAMSPIGLAIAGPISDVISVQAWYMIAGIVCVLMAFVGLVVPAVYNVESNNPNKQPDPVAQAGSIEAAVVSEVER